MSAVPDHAELLLQTRQDVLKVAGVADVRSGHLNEVATYLPGSRVEGIRQVGDTVEVHITCVYGRPLSEIAGDVRAVAEKRLGTGVHVLVQDVVDASSVASASE